MYYLIGYIVIGYFVYGLSFAAWQRSWPNLASKYVKSDKCDSWITATLWPIALIAMLIFFKTSMRTKYQGFQWRVK